MSFILEALKRSENERQRQTGPGLATAAEGGHSRRGSPWLGIVVALLVVNLGVLAYLLSRPDSSPGGQAPAAVAPAEGARGRPAPAAAEIRAAPPAQAALPAPSPRPAPAAVPDIPAAAPAEEPAPVAQPTPTRREVRSLSAEAGATAPAAPDPSRATGDGAPPSAGPGTAAVPAPARSQPAPRRSPAQQLPTIQTLTLRGEYSGRPLHLDLHVYYDEPARRLVFINGNKYREGEKIDDQIRLQEIVPDGAVLSDGRQRFLLPSN